jgi:hypothetical protein
MSDQKHTPGPWTVNGFGVGFFRLATLEPLGVCVSCDRAPKPTEEIPNARLIAMAPALLDALRDMVENCLGCMGSGSVPDHTLPPGATQPCIVCAQARAAVAKAEGK